MQVHLYSYPGQGGAKAGRHRHRHFGSGLARLIALASGFGLLALATAFPYRGGFLTRRQCAILTLVYAAYLAAVLFQGPAG